MSVEVATQKPLVVPAAEPGRRPRAPWVAAVLAVGGLALAAYTPVVGRHGNVTTEIFRAALIAAFGDLAEAAEHCPPGCDHRGPDCALDDAG